MGDFVRVAGRRARAAQRYSIRERDEEEVVGGPLTLSSAV